MIFDYGWFCNNRIGFAATVFEKRTAPGRICEMAGFLAGYSLWNTTLGIRFLMVSYSAAWVPLHMTLAAPAAVERRTVSSRLFPDSSDGFPLHDVMEGD